MIVALHPTGVLDVWRTVAGSRRNGRPARLAMVAVFAVAIMALLSAAAANSGIDRRGDRTAWRTPIPAGGGDTAVARMATVTTSAAGRPLIETMYAPLSDAAPTPPGLHEPLAVGQFAVSPALAELAAQRPELDRFRGATAVLNSDALLHRDELAVVRVMRPDDPRLIASSAGMFFESTPTTDVARLATAASDSGAAGGSASGIYRILVALGTVVLVIPAFTMTTAAARLVADRQARDLAIARLLGARRGQLAAVAALDVAGPAVLGATVGAAATFALLPLATLIPVQGGGFWLGDLLPAIGWWLSCALVVVGTAVLTAAMTVRRSAADPLGVAMGRHRRVAGWWRAGVFVIALAAFLSTMGADEVSSVQVMIMWSAMILAIDVIGPLVMRMLAALRIASTRRGVGLVAARRMAADPKAAYRQIGSLVLAAFVAGMLLSATGALGSEPEDATTLRVAPSMLEAGRLADELEQLPGVSNADPVDLGSYRMLVADLDRPDRADEVRAALARLDPGAVAMTRAEEYRSDNTAVADFGRASVMLFLAVAIAAAVSIAAAAVGSIVDQQRALTALRTIGVSLDDLRAARRRAVVAPLVIGATLAATAGVLLGSYALRSSPSGSAVALLAILVAVAVTCALVAQESTTPLLRRMTGDRRALQA